MYYPTNNNENKIIVEEIVLNSSIKYSNDIIIILESYNIIYMFVDKINLEFCKDLLHILLFINMQNYDYIELI